jgi:uncharacterized protein YjbI with pentapeptide repeats
MKKQLLFSLASNLIMEYTGNDVATFDPTIVTSVVTTVEWRPDNAPVTITGPGTTHAFSYVPSSGAHRCIVKVIGGLGLVTSIDSNTDALTSIQNLEKCTKLTTLIANNNPALVLNLSSVSGVTYYLNLIGCPLIQGNLSSVSGVTRLLGLYGCSLIQGNLSSVSGLTYYLDLAGCPLIQGNLSSVSGLTYYLDLSGCSLIQGNLSSVSGVTYYLNLIGCPLIQGNLSSVSGVTRLLGLYGCSLIQGNLSSVSGLTYYLNLSGCSLILGNLVPKTTYCYLGNQSADQTRVDSILDYIYQAVLVDPNYYPAAAPLLSIIANDATPSGIYQAATPPTTGLEKAYFLCHLASHAWTIVWNGGHGP